MRWGRSCSGWCCGAGAGRCYDRGVSTSHRAVIAWLFVLASHAEAAPPTIDIEATTPVVEILDPSGTVDAAAVADAFGKITREFAMCGSDEGWIGDVLTWIVID